MVLQTYISYNPVHIYSVICRNMTKFLNFPHWETIMYVENHQVISNEMAEYKISNIMFYLYFQKALYEIELFPFASTRALNLFSLTADSGFPADSLFQCTSKKNDFIFESSK